MTPHIESPTLWCPSVKRLTLPLIAVGVLAACGAPDDTASRPSPTAAAQSSVPTGSTTGTSSGSPPSTPRPAASEPTNQTAPSPLVDPASTVPVADVPEALKFAAPLVGGGDIELTTLAGRPVLLWFWAPW